MYVRLECNNKKKIKNKLISNDHRMIKTTKERDREWDKNNAF